MAADQGLVARVRTILAGVRAIREIRMFGGTAFMWNGNMLVAASTRGLLVRVGKDAQENELKRSGSRPMVMRGRAMAGYVYIDPGVLTTRALSAWVARAVKFVATLPPKPAATKQRRRMPPGRSTRKGMSK